MTGVTTAPQEGAIDEDAAYRVESFEEFWPHYVRMHSRPETQHVHVVATASAIALVGLAIARRSPVLALLAPLADHAIAQFGHRVFEHNATRPWRNPLWHARAELRMFRWVLEGRMAAETARCTANRELLLERCVRCCAA